MERQKLLMIAPAPAVREGDRITLDGKFASGMRYQAECFPGVFDCILRESHTDIPFHKEVYDPAQHPFGLTVLPRDGVVTEDHLRGYDLIFCSVDDERNLDVPAKARAVGAKLATTLEYTLKTRLAINAVDRDSSALKRAYRALRLIRKEQGRRRFLSQMDGIQANGYPALEVCRRYDPDTLFFLDSRMTSAMLATPEEQAARRDSLLQGAPLRVVYSGRLDPMKGAHHLVPIAARLKAQAVPFHLSIFGTGALETSMAAEIKAEDLGGEVTLGGAIDYESELVPHFRRHADIFLSCHLQDDPSCSFIEAMGCGLAVAGYGNLMWRALCDESHGGWVTPLGKQEAMADLLASLHKDREGVAAASDAALAFARQHDFETMSQRRMAHLADIIAAADQASS